MKWILIALGFKFKTKYYESALVSVGGKQIMHLVKETIEYAFSQRNNRGIMLTNKEIVEQIRAIINRPIVNSATMFFMIEHAIKHFEEQEEKKLIEIKEILDVSYKL